MAPAADPLNNDEVKFLQPSSEVEAASIMAKKERIHGVLEAFDAEFEAEANTGF